MSNPALASRVSDLLAKYKTGSPAKGNVTRAKEEFDFDSDGEPVSRFKSTQPISSASKASSFASRARTTAPVSILTNSKSRNQLKPVAAAAEYEDDWENEMAAEFGIESNSAPLKQLTAAKSHTRAISAPGFNKHLLNQTLKSTKSSFKSSVDEGDEEIEFSEDESTPKFESTQSMRSTKPSVKQSMPQTAMKKTVVMNEEISYSDDDFESSAPSKSAIATKHAPAIKQQVHQRTQSLAKTSVVEDEVEIDEEYEDDTIADHPVTKPAPAPATLSAAQIVANRLKQTQSLQPMQATVVIPPLPIAKIVEDEENYDDDFVDPIPRKPVQPPATTIKSNEQSVNQSINQSSAVAFQTMPAPLSVEPLAATQKTPILAPAPALTVAKSIALSQLSLSTSSPDTLKPLTAVTPAKPALSIITSNETTKPHVPEVAKTLVAPISQPAISLASPAASQTTQPISQQSTQPITALSSIAPTVASSPIQSTISPLTSLLASPTTTAHSPLNSAPATVTTSTQSSPVAQPTNIPNNMSNGPTQPSFNQFSNQLFNQTTNQPNNQTAQPFAQQQFQQQQPPYKMFNQPNNQPFSHTGQPLRGPLPGRYPSMSNAYSPYQQFVHPNQQHYIHQPISQPSVHQYCMQQHAHQPQHSPVSQCVASTVSSDAEDASEESEVVSPARRPSSASKRKSSYRRHHDSHHCCCRTTHSIQTQTDYEIEPSEQPAPDFTQSAPFSFDQFGQPVNQSVNNMNMQPPHHPYASTFAGYHPHQQHGVYMQPVYSNPYMNTYPYGPPMSPMIPPQTIHPSNNQSINQPPMNAWAWRSPSPAPSAPSVHLHQFQPTYQPSASLQRPLSMSHSMNSLNSWRGTPSLSGTTRSFSSSLGRSINDWPSNVGHMQRPATASTQSLSEINSAFRNQLTGLMHELTAYRASLDAARG